METINKKRGFELISKYAGQTDLLPVRSTEHAAGYDMFAAERVEIKPTDKHVLVPLGIKAYMQPTEVLYLFDRSSNPKKKGVVLTNSVGVIDSDYYNNPDNEGHMFAQFCNITDETIVIERGDRILQGVFMPFLIADNDHETEKQSRQGGFGSTGD